VSISAISTTTPTPQTSATTSALVTGSISVTAGDLIVATVATYDHAAGTGDVTDSNGNTYTRRESQLAGTASYLNEFWALAANTVSLTVSMQANGGATSDFRTGSVTVYRSTNGFPVDPVDTSAAAASTGANPVSPSVTPTAAGTVVRISISDDASNAAYTQPGGSWNDRVNDYGTFDHNALVVADQFFTSAPGATTGTWTRATGPNFTKIAVVYKENAGGGSYSPPFQSNITVSFRAA
jgi:hypothetical protein